MPDSIVDAIDANFEDDNANTNLTPALLQPSNAKPNDDSPPMLTSDDEQDESIGEDEEDEQGKDVPDEPARDPESSKKAAMKRPCRNKVRN